MSIQGPAAKRKMIPKERRQHFLINRPLQFRYMLTVSGILLVVLLVCLVSLYFGIWGGVLDVFSNERTREDLLTASRLQEYEEARRPPGGPENTGSILSLFRQVERLSERQREVFRSLLDETNRTLVGKLALLLLLIAWGSIFLSHKIAGPLYHFQRVFEQIAQGDLAVRCRLRKFDEAKPVAQALNQTLEFLDDALSRLKTIVGGEGTPDQVVARMKEELANFKTSGKR